MVDVVNADAKYRRRMGSNLTLPISKSTTSSIAIGSVGGTLAEDMVQGFGSGFPAFVLTLVRARMP